MWAQVENSKRRRNRSTLLSSQHLEGYKGMLELQDGTRKSWQASLTHTGLHTTHTKWLVHSWSTLGAKTSHGQHGHIRLTTARTWGKPPPYSILCGWPWSLHPNDFSLPGLPSGSPEILPVGTPATMEPHNFVNRPLIEVWFEAKL